MMKSTPGRILLAALGFMLAAGSAFAIGRWAQDPADSPPVALPTFDSPAPAIVGVPVANGDVWEQGLVIAAQAALSRETASDLGVALEASEIVFQPIARTVSSSASGASTAPTTLDTVAETEPADAGTEEAPPTHPPGDSDETGVRAVDTCADERAPDSCPAGIGGTILAIRDLPDLSGIIDFDPLAPGTAAYNAWPECPPEAPSAGRASLGIATNRPAITTVEYQARGGLLRDVGTEWEVFEHTTPDAAEPAWEAWVADESAGTDDPRLWIDHCVQLTGLEPGAYIARASYKDKYDTTITYESVQRDYFSVPDETGEVPRQHRRPTTVIGYGIDRLYVGATRTPEQTLKVVAHENGNGNSCNTDGNIDQLLSPLEGRVDGRVTGDTEIDSDLLTDPTYPYLPSHSRSVLARLELSEGTNYVVCLYWIRSDGPAFQPRSVEIAEVAFVSTPEAYRPTLRLHGFVNLFGTLEQVAVRVQDSYCPSVSVPFEGAFRAERRSTPAIGLCSWDTGLTDIALDGISIRVSANEPDGFPITSATHMRTNLRCTTAPCRIRVNELILVPLPEVPTTRRLCGTGYGSSCDSDIPMRSAGDALIEIAYDGAPGNGATEWTIGDASEFPDTDPPLGDTPLIAVTAEGVFASSPTLGTSLAVTVTADRPVSLTARIIGDTDGGEACVLGPVESYSNDTLLTAHTFTFRNLCLFEEYRVEFTGQDGDGRSVAVYDGVTRELSTTADLLTPAVSIMVRISAIISSPRNDSWHTVTLEPARITPDLAGTDPERRRLDSGPSQIGWVWTSTDVDGASDDGWSLYGVRDGVSIACGEPLARTLTLNGRPRGSWAGYLADTEAEISVVIRVFENRPRGGATEGDCVRGDRVEFAELRATVTLADLMHRVEIRSESGAITFRMQVVGWSPA